MVGKYSCGNSQSTNYRFEEIEEGEGDTVPMVTPKTSSNREFFSLSLSLFFYSIRVCTEKSFFISPIAMVSNNNHQLLYA